MVDGWHVFSKLFLYLKPVQLQVLSGLLIMNQELLLGVPAKNSGLLQAESISVFFQSQVKLLRQVLF